MSLIASSAIVCGQALERYLVYMREDCSVTEEVIRQRRRHVKDVEDYLGKPVLQAEVGAEIRAAIIEAGKHLRSDYNGGEPDEIPGTTHRWRLGIAVKCYLTWAHCEGLIEKNVYPKNTFRRPVLKEKRPFDNEKQKVLFGLDMPLRDRALVRFFYDTGFRRTEVRNTKKSDINREDRSVSVISAKSKKRKSVPISPETFDLLMEYMSTTPGEYLFPTSWGKRASSNTMGIWMRKIGERAGFRTNAHAFRHTCATDLFEAGADTLTLMNHMGLESERVAKHYAHQVTTRRLREAQERRYKEKQKAFSELPQRTSDKPLIPPRNMS